MMPQPHLPLYVANAPKVKVHVGCLIFSPAQSILNP